MFDFRYSTPGHIQNHLNDEDLDRSYFRRRATSFLGGSSEAKRFTWMAADEECVRLEGPRYICKSIFTINLL